MYENVTAIVPAFNESENITATVNALKKINSITEIIAVNDGSIDNTYEILKKIDNIIIINNKHNSGKGHAIKSALPYVSNKYVLLVDADLNYSAVELEKLIDYSCMNCSSMLVAVYPKPLVKGGFGLVKNLSKRGIYMLTSKSCDSVLSGQRLIFTDFLKHMDLPDNFGLEFKITLEALRNNISIIEIPLNIRHRESKRDINGLMHRGKQLAHILKVVIRELI